MIGWILIGVFVLIGLLWFGALLLCTVSRRVREAREAREAREEAPKRDPLIQVIEDMTLEEYQRHRAEILKKASYLGDARRTLALTLRSKVIGDKMASDIRALTFRAMLEKDRMVPADAPISLDKTDD